MRDDVLDDDVLAAEAATEASTEAVSSDGGPASGAPRSLGRSSLVMATGTAASRLLGLVRNVLLVAAIGGAGAVANAFDVSNKLPNVMFAILAGGVLNAVLVPQIVKAYRSHNPQERLDKLLTLSGTGILALTALLTGLSTVVVAIYSNFDDPATTQLAVVFAYWCTPQLFFYGLYTLLGQVLNARGQFGPFMWAPVVNNIVSILGFGAFLLLFGASPNGISDVTGSWDSSRTALLAGTATLGIAAQALVLLVPLWRSGFRWHLRFGYRGIGLRSVGKVAVWTFGAVLLDQLGTLFITRFASSTDQAASALGIDPLTVAGNAAYTQALMIYLLPHSLVTVSVATALFTGMSRAAADGDLRQVRLDLSQGVRTVGVFTVFATAVFVVLSVPITKALVPTMGADAVAFTAPVLVAMACGLVPLGGMVLMKWVFYAFEDGRTVFWIQVPATIALIGGGWAATHLLDIHWWVVGVGAAMAFSNVVAVALRLGGLRRLLHGVDGARILRMHVKVVLAAGVAGAVGWGVLQLFGELYGQSWLRAIVVTAAVGLVMTGVYVVLLRVMRVRELDQLLTPVMRRLRR